ncbi:hypothetical protein K1X76_08345 [bacterium]|nr:hypothetical protein [bacterium]
MDPIVAKLNDALNKKVQESIKPQGEGVSFQNTLDDKITSRFIDRLKDDAKIDVGQNMSIVSADDIKIETTNPELDTNKIFSASDQMENMFKEMNNGLLGMDSALETIAAPNTKLSYQDCLKLQMFTAHTGLMAEAFSKFTDGLTRGITTILQTQAG